MKVLSLKTENYRNLAAKEYFPGGGVNIICGENGLGKTNLIESIWLFTGCRSFRSVRDKDVVRFDCDEAKLKMEFFSGNRNKEAEIRIDEKRHITLNGIALPSGRKMMGEFTAVVFTPLHLSIVKEGPEERRKFIDIAISQLRPNYAKTLLEYTKALAQRNATLRAARDNPAMLAMLDIWDMELAKKGAVIIDSRINYLDALKNHACTAYDEISSGKETLGLTYKEYARDKARGKKEIAESLLNALYEKRESDVERCITSVGAHREDFSIDLSGKSARLFGSQGQQRSAALSLKLAEANIISQVTAEEPVILLDDVFSELDPQRQKYVVSHFENRQVFITCCDEENISRIAGLDVTVERL
ncbi:MAG: DNA replication/repair protein RecF [Acutalibacteraceae bacterium]|nr:DNA replication/repair protein RecF [Acutalibacteraceae bacterium]